MYTFNQMLCWTGMYVRVGATKLLPLINEQKLHKFVLLLGNVKGQMLENFKDVVVCAKGLHPYGLPGAAEPWQPFDTEYAATLNALITAEHGKWLDTDNQDR